jgi:hypothetical protein
MLSGVSDRAKSKRLQINNGVVALSDTPPLSEAAEPATSKLRKTKGESIADAVNDQESGSRLDPVTKAALDNRER